MAYNRPYDPDALPRFAEPEPKPGQAPSPHAGAPPQQRYDRPQQPQYHQQQPQYQQHQPPPGPISTSTITHRGVIRRDMAKDSRDTTSDTTQSHQSTTQARTGSDHRLL
ncbi:hypothetical protein TrVGV298_005592 [Trichoderma virens]|nr:hypothetical protein TrVGV298_005592 [Trichoderma virens]